MKSSPSSIIEKFLYLILLTFVINISCNKDTDLSQDAVIGPTSTSVEEGNLNTDSRLEEIYFNENDLPAMGFETRTAIFHPINPTQAKSAEGKGENIEEPEKVQGYSYLMFDLGQIDSIGGTLNSAKLELMATYDGIDTVSVFKGSPNDWAESAVPQGDAPKLITLLGELKGEFASGQKQEIVLEKSKLVSEQLALVIPNKESNNSSFTSEENTNSDPILVVSYFVPKGAQALTVDKEVPQNTDAKAVSTGEKNLSAINAKASFANTAPDSRPSASVVSGNAPLTVKFGSSKSSDDKGIASYKWYFMDGTTATGANPSHTFTEPGIYKVILSIRDAEGLENGRIIIITVTGGANKPPDSRPSASPVSGNAPLKVQFGSSKSSDDKGIASYKWYFMDGTTSTSASPSHIFANPGIYKVILSIKDKEGLENGRIIIITVTGGENKPPDARPSASPASGNAPLKVQFGSSKSSDDTGIASYKWDFRDGATSTSASPTHTFNNPGTYKVILTVTDNGGLKNSRYFVVTVTGTSTGDGGGGGSTPTTPTTPTNPTPTNGVKASSFGYNSSNATNALKAAINSSNSTIIVDKQSGDWIVEPLYFTQLRNKTIIFEDGVVLRAKNGAFRPADRLFQLVNANNVQIIGYGATFKMNKAEYSGQQNHVLSIVSSSNITVKGITVRDGGGDGIYISRYGEGEYCSNIRIEDVVSTYNQRQGMTIVSVDGLVVKNATFSNTSGEAPGAGVDFECESVRDRFTNITFDNCVFRDNYGPGILTAFSKTSSSSIPLDITFNNSYLTNNFSTSNTRNPAEIDLGMSTNSWSSPIKGTITFNGLRVENSKWSAIWTKKTAEAYKVVVKNATIKNVSKASNKAAIHIGLLSYGNKSTANMGGFTFENVLISYDGVDPSLRLFGPGHNNWNLKNMLGEIRVQSPSGIQFSDNMNKLETTNSSNVTLEVVKN